MNPADICKGSTYIGRSGRRRIVCSHASIRVNGVKEVPAVWYLDARAANSRQHRISLADFAAWAVRNVTYD